MKLFIKYSVLAIIVLVSGVLIFLVTLDINQYKPVLVKTVSEMTGRELQIAGDLNLTPSLTPVISAQGISLANTSWSSSGNSLLSVGSVEAKVALLPLLSGKVEIKQFILLDTQISLETDAAGTGNWLMGAETDEPVSEAAPEADRGQMPESVEISDVIIRNARITYIDGIIGTTTRFAINELTTGVSDLNAPVAFTLNADYGTNPIQLAGTLGPVSTLLADTRYPVDISGQVSAFNVKAIGTIEKPLSIEGLDINVTADTSSLSEFNRYVGQDLPALSPVTLSANLKFADLRDINIEALKIQIGQTDLSGQLNYQAAEDRPLVSMQLQSALIDLVPFIKDTEDQPKPEYLFPRDPLPVAAMSRINLQMSLAADLLKTKKSDLTDVTVELTLEDGELRSTIGSGIAGGKLTGNISLAGRADLPPAFSIDINGAAIQLGQLPHDEQKPWFSNGPIRLQIKGTSQGNNVAEIMGAYDGNLLIEVGAATMPNSNVNLFGADILMSVFNKLNPLSNTEENTHLECAVINLNIQDGVARIDRQIALQTTKMRMVGSGEINFKTEQLSLGIKPYAREGVGLNLGSVAGMAKIGGTLANQKMEVDAQGVLKAGATAGAALATGGLSLLAQGLFSRTTDDPAPCKTALGQADANQAQTGSTTEAPAEAEKKGLLDNVKGGFNKLFGR